MKLKNIFLALSLIAFAIGFSDGGESAFWYMGRPVGAILFMLFMIFNLLEKESALLDEQRRAAGRLDSAARPCSATVEKNTDLNYAPHNLGKGITT